MSASEARVRFAELTDPVVYGGEAVYLCGYGCAVANHGGGGTACGDGDLAVAHLGQGDVTR